MMLHLLLLPLCVSGHGNMVWPPVWWDIGGQVGLTPGASCFAGHEYTFLDDPAKSGANCLWYTNYTHIVGEPTLAPEMRTFPNIEPYLEDCGYPYGGGFAYGPNAEDFEFHDVVVTEWTIGGTEVAGWGQVANHGGGYSYRLCKLGPGGKADLTEECFQQTPLRFASDMSWVQVGEDESSKVSFKANRTREGTVPKGSEWTKNPIPNCAGLGGGFGDPDASCPGGLQFPAPAPGLFGQGANIHPGVGLFQWTLMDELEVPSNLSPGDYVLSFRWDCEQTPQVWSACADIKLVQP